eukprot:297470-Pelagomonas_calceolata.AAC.4
MQQQQQQQPCIWSGPASLPNPPVFVPTGIQTNCAPDKPCSECEQNLHKPTCVACHVWFAGIRAALSNPDLHEMVARWPGQDCHPCRGHGTPVY